MSWRQALYWYVGIGLAIGVVMLPKALLHKRGSSASDKLIDALDALDPKRQTAWYRFRERVLFPLLIVPAMGLAWPIVTGILGWDAWTRRGSQRIPQPEDQPEVSGQDLIELVEVAAIEATEYVRDPLGAVPQLPFGHLNGAWQAFLAKRKPGEELWRYQSTHAHSWGGPETRKGYVWVRDRRIGEYFRAYQRKHKNSRESTEEKIAYGRSGRRHNGNHPG